MVQKAVNEKAKASLKSSIMVWDADFRCFRGHCLSQNTFAKVQTQDLTIKKSKPEESRPKETKPTNSNSSTLPYFNEAVKPNR